MKTVQIYLDTIAKVASFVDVISEYDYDCNLSSGEYLTDARSALGIFSLNLLRPMELTIHTENEVDEMLEALEEYMHPE